MAISEGVQLIAAALTAGAAAGATATASAAVTDSYNGFKKLVADRLSKLLKRKKADEAVAIEAEADSATVAQRLSWPLVESGAASDEEVLEAARQLLKLTGPADAAAVVNIRAGRDFMTNEGSGSMFIVSGSGTINTLDDSPDVGDEAHQ